MTQEDKKELEIYFPLNTLSNEEIEHCQKLSKNRYIPVVKYLRNIHPEIGLKEARIYYDLYFDN